MANFTPNEQLLLELVNRARLDPNAEASRFGIGLNSGISALDTITGVAKPALAPNGLLVNAARAHSVWMLDNDIFSHNGINGTSPHQRMINAGYLFANGFASGENIAIRGTTGTPNVTAEVVSMHEDLFKSPGHRLNILKADFRELGTGVASGTFPFQLSNGSTQNFNSVDATQNFAFSGTKFFVTGVCITDADGDNFYDIGEARSGITVEVRRSGTLLSDTTEPAGGYGVAAEGGICTVTFKGGALATAVNCTVNTSAGNVKVDLAGSNEILSSGNVTLGAGASHATLLGVANLSATGTNLVNTLTGNRGANTLNGLGGNDNLLGIGGSDQLFGGGGVDRLTGGSGRDRLTGGTERDVFDFNVFSESARGATTRDVITDFQLGLDDIDLSTLDAITGGANDPFSFIGKTAFNGTTGNLRYFQENPTGTANDKTIVEGDVNGDRIADFQVELTGIIALTSSDFIL